MLGAKKKLGNVIPDAQKTHKQFFLRFFVVYFFVGGNLESVFSKA